MHMSVLLTITRGPCDCSQILLKLLHRVTRQLQRLQSFPHCGYQGLHFQRVKVFLQPLKVLHLGRRLEPLQHLRAATRANRPRALTSEELRVRSRRRNPWARLRRRIRICRSQMASRSGCCEPLLQSTKTSFKVNRKSFADRVAWKLHEQISVSPPADCAVL